MTNTLRYGNCDLSFHLNGMFDRLMQDPTALEYGISVLFLHLAKLIHTRPVFGFFEGVDIRKNLIRVYQILVDFAKIFESCLSPAEELFKAIGGVFTSFCVAIVKLKKQRQIADRLYP